MLGRWIVWSVPTWRVGGWKRIELSWKLSWRQVMEKKCCFDRFRFLPLIIEFSSPSLSSRFLFFAFPSLSIISASASTVYIVHSGGDRASPSPCALYSINWVGMEFYRCFCHHVMVETKGEKIRLLNPTDSLQIVKRGKFVSWNSNSGSHSAFTVSPLYNAQMDISFHLSSYITLSRKIPFLPMFGTARFNHCSKVSLFKLLIYYTLILTFASIPFLPLLSNKKARGKITDRTPIDFQYYSAVLKRHIE